MTRLLAIDPGNTDSGWCVVEHATLRPSQFDKTSNTDLRNHLAAGTLGIDRAAIEMVESFGMAVGREVFVTCVWIGRFAQTLEDRGIPVDLVRRGEVKVHHCHSRKAKDSNIKQALVDRFATGTRNHGKGTKNEPGWFYGFAADVWQAYALAVYIADTIPTLAPSAPAAATPVLQGPGWVYEPDLGYLDNTDTTPIREGLL